MTDISQENADIIGEIANICIGNAATTLSLILGKSTNITAPNVEVLKKEDALCNDERILIKVPYTKGLDGTNLLIIRLNDALVIANLMMGGDGTNVSGMSLDEMTLSAISEAMNQMCGTIATSMSALLNEPTDIVKVTFKLTVGDLIDSDLLQLYPLSIVKQIIKQEV